jgi:hypothetical protein
MRDKLQNAPWWVWSLIIWVYMGSMMTVLNHFLQSASWMASAVSGFAGALVMGGMGGPWFVRQRRRTLAAVGALPARDLRIASRAVMRGPVPLDPDIRQAAAQLARLQLKQYSGRIFWLSAVTIAVVAILSGVLVLRESRWWLIGTAMTLAFGVYAALEPRRLRRRIEYLSQEEPSHP